MPSIVIVGAGMAGLAAARTLVERGFNDFVVLEGSERIGGRIHPVAYRNPHIKQFTSSSDGGYLQLGAEFINGSGNPIYDMAKEMGVLAEPLADTAHIDEANYIYGNQPIDKKDIDLFREFIKPLDSRYREFAANYEIMGKTYTFYSLYMEDYERFLKENNITGQRKLVFDALSRSYRSYFEFEWGADWSDLSLSILKHFTDCGPEPDGESFKTDKFGYKAILDCIKSKIPEENIRFNAYVEQIDYSGPKTKIFLQDSEEYIEADHVIVTCSLGHLKRFYKSLFIPPLPAYKKEAIEKIGFGGSCKIYFRWETPFWKQGTHSIAPLPVEGMARETIEPFEREMTTLQTISWEPNTLMAWIAGAGHEVMDNIDDTEIKVRMTRLIRDMMNDQTIAPPSEIVRTRLTKNDLLVGSYSYISKAQAEAGILPESLARPIEVNGSLKICFAGEATHHRLFQTAIGAYFTGIREVNRIFSVPQPAVCGF